MYTTFIPCFVAAMILAGCLAPASAGSEVISWSYAKESETDRETTTYAVSAQLSSITQKNETVFIDYERLRLYRYRKSNNSCESFPLNNPAHPTPQPAGGKEQNLRKMIRILGSFKVITSDERRAIQQYYCLKKHILFAAELSFSQMAVSPEIIQLGQSFSESMISYWITTDVPELETLLHYAGNLSGIFQANPLLRQIDMIGLLEPLKGFPVVIEKKALKGTIKFTLTEIPKKSGRDRPLAVPEECLKNNSSGRN